MGELSKKCPKEGRSGCDAKIGELCRKERDGNGSTGEKRKAQEMIRQCEG